MSKKQKIFNYLDSRTYANESPNSRPSIRDIATATGTSVGMVHKTLKDFLSKKTKKIKILSSEHSERNSDHPKNIMPWLNL